MKNSLLISSLGLASLVGALNFNTATADQSVAQGSPQEESVTRPARLYGGLASGLSLVNGSEFRKNPSGAHVMVIGDLSFDLGSIVMDGGLGWIFNHVTGTQVSGSDFKRDVWGALVELNPSVKLSQSVYFGPILSTVIGNDLQHSYLPSGAFAALFGGLRGTHEFETSGPNMRVFAQALSDLSIQNRQVWLMSLGIQFGIDLEPQTVARSQRETAQDSIDWVKLAQAQASMTPLPFTPTHRTYRVARVSRVARPVEKKQEVRVTLEPALVHFGTDSASLNAKARSVLNQLGQILSKNPGIWETLEVRGHTDERGSYEYNLKLSARRSNAVIGALREGGAPNDKMIAEAFSYTRPIKEGNDEASWSKNRRVEILLKNVSNPEKLEELISQI